MDTVYRYGDNTQDRRLKAIMNQPSVKTKPSDGSAPRDWRYHSTAENLILGRKSNPSQPQGLHYDDAYRLIGTTQGLALGIDTDDFVSDGSIGTNNPGNWRSGYAYDAADNLTQASSESRPEGNWIATPNSLNQITSKGGNSWVYDAAGNLLDDGNRTYEWDAQQRLIALTDKATGRKSEFVYDGQSRLTITKEYPAGSATASETRYLWCGHKVCQSRDGQDNVTARYFDEGEIKTGNTGSMALYYTRDHLGSIMETTQASGKVLGSLDYGPYGEPEKAQGQLPDFRYAGMLHHAPTGLYLTHYRAYDPSVGRWLNRDPIGEQGGINLYSYLGGNPVSFVDPSGLDIEYANHAVAAGFNHSKIIITPANQALYVSDPRFQNIDADGRRFATLGAGPNGTLHMESGVNRPRDVSEVSAYRKKLDLPCQYGDEDAAINNLFTLANNYNKNKVWYTLIPHRVFGVATGYNSNSFISGLGGAAGFDMPTPANTGASTPGYQNPVPASRYR